MGRRVKALGMDYTYNSDNYVSNRYIRLHICIVILSLPHYLHHVAISTLSLALSLFLFLYSL